MYAITAYIAGFLTTIWAWLLVERDRSQNPKQNKQKLLEPWQVADKWHDHILGEK